MPDVKYDVDGVDEVVATFRAMRGELGEEIKGIMSMAARAAEAEMLAKVPRSGKTDNTIASSIRVSEIEYLPGGAGGGGNYQVSVGTGDNAPSHLRYVLEGTGLHGPVGALIRPSGVMVFKDGAKDIFSRTSSGQKPQTEWVEDAQEVTDRTIELAIQQLRA